MPVNPIDVASSPYAFSQSFPGAPGGFATDLRADVVVLVLAVDVEATEAECASELDNDSEDRWF